MDFNFRHLEAISEKMDHPASLEEALRVNFKKSAELEEGIDVRIYNHMLNKSQMAKHFGWSISKFNDQLALFNKLNPQQPVVHYLQGKVKQLFSRFDLDRLKRHFDTDCYSDHHKPTSCLISSHKGGTGKSTSTLTLAVGLALDDKRYPKVCIIDTDPQGTCGAAITHIAEDEQFITIVDLILRNHEDNIVSQLLGRGFSLEQIIESAAFSTHLPNLSTFLSFPTDDRFTDLFWSLKGQERVDLLCDFKLNILPIIKSMYDIILIDSPPQDSPIIWMMYEAVDMVLIPCSPKNYDYISTKNFLKNISNRIDKLPSQGKNIQWSKVAIVNFNSDSKHEVKYSDLIRKACGEHVLNADLAHSQAFLEASETGRSVLDLKKNQLKKTKGTDYDNAIASTTAFMRSFIIELHKVSSK
ncbi:ParA family protein [Photobacterium angustum]|uniref:ParA family protein n=1 Tax=Photobacterium angustum TaxID=661 RepID=A0ABX5GYP7_PHOAN|nr:ParA family protein [Photobacterium angustum]PSX01668.1 ParA family protein [Photobacterium angustum]